MPSNGEASASLASSILLRTSLWCVVRSLAFSARGAAPGSLAWLESAICARVLRGGLARLVDREQAEAHQHDRADDDRGPANRRLDHPNKIGIRMDSRETLIAELRAHALVIGEVTLDERRAGASTTSTPSARSCARAGFLALGDARRRARARAGRDRGRRHDDGRRPGRLRRARRRRRRQGVLRPQGRQGARPRSAASRARCWTTRDRCLVVEDVVTTGGSTLAAIEALQEEGRAIVGVVACSTGSPAAASGSSRPRARPTSRSPRSTTSTPSGRTAEPGSRFALSGAVGRRMPRPGFEPGACSLGGSRSIQLSYRGADASGRTAGAPGKRSMPRSRMFQPMPVLEKAFDPRRQVSPRPGETEAREVLPPNSRGDSLRCRPRGRRAGDPAAAP